MFPQITALVDKWESYCSSFIDFLFQLSSLLTLGKIICTLCCARGPSCLLSAYVRAADGGSRVGVGGVGPITTVTSCSCWGSCCPGNFSFRWDPWPTKYQPICFVKITISHWKNKKQPVQRSKSRTRVCVCVQKRAHSWIFTYVSQKAAAV